MSDIIFLEYWENALETLAEVIDADRLDKLDCGEMFEISCQKPLKDLVEQCMEHADKDMEQFHRDSLIDVKNNCDILEETWGRGFALYAFFIDSYVKFSNSFVQLVDDFKIYSEENKYTFEALDNLNGRAIQVANGILVSLRNGYPDDGYSRTRTLCELLITISFINRHGNLTAKNYIEYCGNKYHWASDALATTLSKSAKNITFSDLESNCGLDKDFIEKWHSEYFKMHKLVHASPQGTFNRFGGYMKDSIPIGPTDKGVNLVAMNVIQLMKTIFHQYMSFARPEEDMFVRNLLTSYLHTLDGIGEKMVRAFEESEALHFGTELEGSNND